MSRRAASTEAAAAIETLRGEGAEVRVVQGDVASATDVGRALAEARAILGPCAASCTPLATSTTACSSSKTGRASPA